MISVPASGEIAVFQAVPCFERHEPPELGYRRDTGGIDQCLFTWSRELAVGDRRRAADQFERFLILSEELRRFRSLDQVPPCFAVQVSRVSNG